MPKLRICFLQVLLIFMLHLHFYFANVAMVGKKLYVPLLVFYLKFFSTGEIMILFLMIHLNFIKPVLPRPKIYLTSS